MSVISTTTAVEKIGRDTYTVPSQSRPGELHVVKLVAGVMTCTCDASLYRGRCRHGAAVEQFILDTNRNRPMIDAATRHAAMNLLLASKHRT